MTAEDVPWSRSTGRFTILAMTEHRHSDYLSGMGHDRLIRLYDPVTWLLGLRRAHLRLLDAARIRPGERVLEIGCGTGNLALLVKREVPDAEVTGLDPDPLALHRAERKAARAGVAIRFDRGFAGELPYADASFDHVLSSFMFHHVPEAEQEPLLAEARRVLAPGGRLDLLDFGGTAPARGRIARRMQRNAHMHGNLGDRIPALMRAAGFTDAAEAGARATLLGPQAHWTAAAGG